MESLNKHNIIDLWLKAGEFAYANAHHKALQLLVMTETNRYTLHTTIPQVESRKDKWIRRNSAMKEINVFMQG